MKTLTEFGSIEQTKTAQTTQRNKFITWPLQNLAVTRNDRCVLQSPVCGSCLIHICCEKWNLLMEIVFKDKIDNVKYYSINWENPCPGLNNMPFHNIIIAKKCIINYDKLWHSIERHLIEGFFAELLSSQCVFHFIWELVFLFVMNWAIFCCSVQLKLS